jgi:hypothetical protein
MARDISQRVEPDVRPLKPRSLCIYCREDAPACHHAVRRRALLAFNVSCPIRWQATSGSSSRRPPVQSVNKQYTCAVWRTRLIIPSTRSFPSTPRRGRSRMSGHKKIAPTANICSFKCYIHYVPGPTCRGSVPLCMPPSAIKGEAYDVTGHPILGSLRHSQVHTSAQAIHHTVE